MVVMLPFQSTSSQCMQKFYGRVLLHITAVILRDEVLMWSSVWSEVQIVCVWSSCCHCRPKTHHLLPHLNPNWFYVSGIGLRRLSWKRGS